MEQMEQKIPEEMYPSTRRECTKVLGGNVPKEERERETRNRKRGTQGGTRTLLGGTNALLQCISSILRHSLLSLSLSLLGTSSADIFFLSYLFHIFLSQMKILRKVGILTSFNSRKSFTHMIHTFLYLSFSLISLSLSLSLIIFFLLHSLTIFFLF